MAIARAALIVAALAALGIVLVSGGSDADPRTPPALPGLPPPFLGTAVSGDGGLTAAVDSYGDVVDLRAGPAGPALIDNPAARQVAGTVPADTGIVPMVSVGPDGDPEPLWEGESVRQHYLHGTNVVETVGFVKEARLIVTTAVAGDSMVMELNARSSRQGRALPAISVEVEEDGIDCAQAERAGVLYLLCRVGRALPPEVRTDSRELFREGDRVVRRAGEAHRWVAGARGLGAGAPRWARAMYDRSLLVLRALTDRRSGAVAAGARDGWAYVWPRDAATAALAYAAAGYRGEARRVAGFLSGLGTRTGEAARFDGDGAPVPGRGPQGDAPGWIAAAARAAEPNAQILVTAAGLLGLPDYQEGAPGTYLGNAIADHEEPARIAAEFETPKGLVRRAGDPSSGLDSAAAWAVRPFSSPSLYPAARRTLLNLAAEATPYGITPGEGWRGGVDPWTAPTAWSAWSLAALGDRAAALGLLADLRRAATQAGALPERVDATTGTPRSTTPLLWSHAFAILALQQLWPGGPAAL